MGAKNFVIGTLGGGVVLFAMGYVMFELVFGEFYAANEGSVSGLMREEQLLWAVALGSLSYAALLTLGIGSRAAAPSITEGAKVGLVIGFLAWLTADLTLYGVMNIASPTKLLVDPVLEAVHGGFGGAAIGALLAKMRP